MSVLGFTIGYNQRGLANRLGYIRIHVDWRFHDTISKANMCLLSFDNRMNSIPCLKMVLLNAHDKDN